MGNAAIDARAYERLREQAEDGLVMHGSRGDTVSVAQADLRALLAEVDRLREVEWVYEGLCK